MDSLVTVSDSYGRTTNFKEFGGVQIAELKGMLKMIHEGTLSVECSRRKTRQQIIDLLTTLNKDGGNNVFCYDEQSSSGMAVGALVGAGAGLALSAGAAGIAYALAPIAVGSLSVPVVGWLVGGAIFLVIFGAAVGGFVGHAASFKCVVTVSVKKNCIQFTPGDRKSVV